jgi:hypothetical protein
MAASWIEHPKSTLRSSTAGDGLATTVAQAHRARWHGDYCRARSDRHPGRHTRAL